MLSLCAAPGSGASNASAQSSGPSQTSPQGGDHLHALRGWLLVQRDGRLDGARHARVGLEPGDGRVGLRHRRGSLGHEVAQRARLHAFLAEAGQHVGDVRQVGLVGADEQHAAATVAQARVGVQQVCRAVQCDHRLAGAGAAVDDEWTPGPGPDDGVLVGRDGAEHVAHPARTAASEAGDERGLVVERCGVGQPVSGEHLVPVVGDPAAAPPVPPTAAEAHRVGVGGPEERLGRWGAPVEQQPTTVAVGEAEPPDVCRLGILRGDDAPEAQVQPEPPEGTQACGQPVDLQVPVQRRLAAVRGCPACLIQAFRKVGDRLLEALGDGGEVPLVARDQGRVRLADEALGKVEGAGGQGTHVIGSSLERACGAMRPPVRGRAARSRGTSEDWGPVVPEP